MAKRQSLLIAACLVLTALALILPFRARVVLAALTFVGALVWIATALRKHEPSSSSSPDRVDQSTSPEDLPINSLLEATLSGMREGLLVVNKDMRVVASNPATCPKVDLPQRSTKHSK
jgi:hypothetical protein